MPDPVVAVNVEEPAPKKPLQVWRTESRILEVTAVRTLANAVLYQVFTALRSNASFCLAL